LRLTSEVQIAASPQTDLFAALAQAPLPSHPLVQPPTGQRPLTSTPLLATFEQVPCLPASAHDLHTPSQATLQQNPWKQRPFPQSWSIAHLPPTGRLPHDPAVQNDPASHWLSLPQVPTQPLPLQPLKGAQECISASAGQTPSSHLAAMVAVFVTASHLAARQVVLASYFEHSPMPSHLPSVPQVLAAVTGHIASETPAATGAHLPRVVPAQVMHSSVQALSQQTPSTQKLLSHWAFCSQVWPGPNLPQLPLRQVLPATH
jgi:hypothetical protein